MTGILLVDKPEGITSHTVVAKLRRLLGTRRIGHSGTLDPLATGLLVCFIGRATRAAEFAESAHKEYIAGLRIGVVTDTQDITGKVLGISDRRVTVQDVEVVLDRFRGEQTQIPPMYSAVKVDGKRLYKYMREGVEVERKPRQITVHDLRLTGENEGDFELFISCSKGTYVRTLCHDIGQVLDVGAVMSRLRRVAAGEFSIAEAYTLDQIEEAVKSDLIRTLLIPVDSLFAEFDELRLGSSDTKMLKNGVRVSVNAEERFYRVYSECGEFLALSEVKSGALVTKKSFYELNEKGE